MLLKRVRVPLATASSVALAALAVPQAGAIINRAGYAASPAGAGVTWTVQHTPNPVTHTRNHETFLASVSCSSARACTAVGVQNRGTGPAFTTVPVAERWNGKRWKLQHIAGRRPLLTVAVTGVSCPTAHRCMAVGQLGRGAAAAWRWNGRRWKRVLRHAPGKALYAVSCPRARICIAVGDKGNSNLSGSWFAERWSGRSWRLLTASPVSAESALSGLTCTSATNCIAVGDTHTPGFLPLAEHWDGNTWTATPQPPLPAGQTGGWLGSVSCASATSCVALGNSLPSTQFAEGWNGSTWTLLPAMPHAQADGLSGLSCLPGGQCIVVGETFTASHTFQARAEMWDGAHWTVEAAQSPSSDNTVLTGVSCVSVTVCEAVGYYSKTLSHDLIVSLAERRS